MTSSISILILMIGLIFISVGYALQVSGGKDISREIEFVPRSIYDQLVHSNVIQ